MPPGAAWPAIAASSLLVIGMSGLLARASARGDISIVGPILALSPIFTILPDAALSGARPSALGWLGLALSLAGTVSLSGPGAAGLLGRVRVLFARRDALDALGAAFFLGFLAAVDRWAALAIGPPSYLVSLARRDRDPHHPDRAADQPARARRAASRRATSSPW